MVGGGGRGGLVLGSQGGDPGGGKVVDLGADFEA